MAGISVFGSGMAIGKADPFYLASPFNFLSKSNLSNQSKYSSTKRIANFTDGTRNNSPSHKSRGDQPSS